MHTDVQAPYVYAQAAPIKQTVCALLDARTGTCRCQPRTFTFLDARAYGCALTCLLRTYTPFHEHAFLCTIDSLHARAPNA